MEINIKVFYKLIVSFLMVIVKHAQNTQNSKFVIYLQYLKKEGWDEVDFMHPDKIKLSYKVIPFIWWDLPGLPKLPKIASLQNLCNTSRKK